MIQILLLLTVFSLDTLLVSIAYSIKKINISYTSAFIISFISSISLLFALIIGNLFKIFLTPNISNIIGFIFLLILGIHNIFQEKIKNKISKYDNKMVEIYLDETKADLNNSKNLNYKEAILLSIILSIDSLIGGISISFMNHNIIFIIVYLLALNVCFLKLGNYLFKKLDRILNLNTSYISGIILIILAIITFIL